VLAKESGVDLLDRFLGRESHVEDAEEGHETRIDAVVGTARWRNTSHVEHVNDGSEIQLAASLVEFVALNEELEKGVG